MGAFVHAVAAALAGAPQPYLPWAVWPLTTEYILELFVEFGDYDQMDTLLKILCYARKYEIGSLVGREGYLPIPEHLQRILDRAAAESK